MGPNKYDGEESRIVSLPHADTGFEVRDDKSRMNAILWFNVTQQESASQGSDPCYDRVCKTIRDRSSVRGTTRKL